MTSNVTYGDTNPPLTPLSESLPLFHTPQSSDNLRSSLPARLTSQIEDIIQGLDKEIYNNEEIEAIFQALRKYSKKKANGKLKEHSYVTSVTTITNEYLKLNLNEPLTIRTLTERSLQQQASVPGVSTPTVKQFSQRSFESLSDRQRSFSSPSSMEKPRKQSLIDAETNKQIVLMDLVDIVCKPNDKDNEYRCGRDYISPHKLGEGAFGVVRYCEDNSTGKNFAQKIIHIAKYKKAELEIQRKLSTEISYHVSEDSGEISCGVVLILGAIQQSNIIYMFMDLMEDGSLAEMLREAMGSLNLSYILWYFRQVLEGLAYIHTRRIIHQDIKADNILVKNGDYLKIADFGLATQIPDMCEAVYEGFYGTPNFMAPEVIREELVSTKSDIWAAGCVFYELITQHVPWKGIEINTIFYTVGSGRCEYINKHTRPSQDRLEELAKDFQEEYQFDCDALNKLNNIFQQCFELKFHPRSSANEILESESFVELFSLMGAYDDEIESEITNLDSDLEPDDIVESLDIRDEMERPFTSLIDFNAPISLQVDSMRP